MPREFEGQLVAPRGRIAVVVARYNESITQKLLAGALDVFKRYQVADDAVDVFWVPGAFEISSIAAVAAHSDEYRAVICLGAVIRGETTHDQHINRAVSLAITQLALETGLPILNGVLTCNTLEQAIHRAGGNVGNKGAECAEAALRMLDLLDTMPGPEIEIGM